MLVRTSCKSFAAIQSFVNRKACAPPDLERHITRGSFSRRTLLTSALWSREYSSISIQPQTHLEDSLIGTMPIAAPLPERCSSQSAVVRGLRTIWAFPVCLPFLLPFMEYVPWASSSPLKTLLNLSDCVDKASPINRGALHPPTYPQKIKTVRFLSLSRFPPRSA